MSLFIQDTIVAPATIPGTGAISVVRISGAEALEVTDKVVSFKSLSARDSKGYTIKFGSVYSEDGKLLDEVLVSIYKAPHSYTGEDSVEISCHASSYIVSKLIMQLVNAGARLAEAGEFTKRAFVNGKMDLAQAESVADLISSQDAASHRVAINQLKGGISNELKKMRSELLEMAALMELELDFSEEDVEFADRNKLNSLLESVYNRISELCNSFRLGNAIKNGIPVAIVGPANAGKSSLLNSLIGEDRAIVSEIAGTTRDSIEEVYNVDGIRFRFIDTAGVRDTLETIEKIGIQRTFKQLEKAEIVLIIVDAADKIKDVENTISHLIESVDLQRQKVAILVNKCDILGVNKNVIYINKYVLSIDNKIFTLNVSAKTGHNLNELKQWLTFTQIDRLNTTQDSILVTNIRHYEALRSALSSLSQVQKGLQLNVPSDLVAQDLCESINSLSSIIGESITPSETLNFIFQKFCIGK